MENLYNLTSAQHSIWLTEQVGTNTSLNNIGGYVFIHDQVNFNYLEKALKLYIQKNPILDTKVKTVDGEPKQYLSEFEDFNIDLVELKDISEIEPFNQTLVGTPFDFLDSTLYKFVLFKLPDGRGGFNATFHHFVADAWSMSLFIDEVVGHYESLTNHKPITYDINPSYTDFISTENDYLNSSRFLKDAKFWNDTFDIAPELSYISNNKNQSMNTLAKRKAFKLNSDQYHQLTNFLKKYNCSIYTFFMAIYSIYVAKINNHNSPIIGTPVLNRANFKEKHTAGMFISTVPFHVSVDFDMNFSDFLSSVANVQIGIFRHQRYPYHILLEDLKKKYGFTHNLYDFAISYQNARNSRNESTINYDSAWLFNGHSTDSLQIHFYDMDNTNNLNIYYDYQVSKFEEQDIENIHSRIMHMCQYVLNHPNVVLKDIEIIDSIEKNKIMNIFNQSEIDHPKNISIYTLIENIGRKYSNNTAVVDYDRSITYQEILDQSDIIAKNLIKNGIKKGDCVSVLFDNKNINLICSLLGVLKAGACFLAIYPDYPNNRIQYMLENSQSKLLITDHHSSSSDFEIPIIYIENMKDIKNISFPNVANDDPAYLIYTSGSTGKPKGTVQTHNNLINFVYSFNHYLDNSIEHTDRFLSVTNICFDVVMSEIFTALMFGATLFLYKDLNYSSPSELSKYIIENKITFSYFPPSMLQSICEELGKYKNIPLNKLLVGVEPIKSSILLAYLDLNPEMKIVNGYGPSETTICCTMYKFDKNLSPDAITPIGSPIGNSKILIYDSNKQLVPIGNIGEIYVQGECVGNGYINNQIATEEKFDLENRIYRTGDLAKWLPDGNILFVGRNDFQIKYRGYRIDLGEIEHCVKNIEEIENCTVLLDNRVESNPTLVAFIILKNESITEEMIRKNLSNILPHYMIPNQFVFLDQFPLTPNGKIDRKYLLSMVSYENKTPYIAPKTDMEKKMAKLWCRVLNKDKIGINDNFFELGGDSLSAIKIITLATMEGFQLSAQDFYTYPTINLLLKHYIETNSSVVHAQYINSIDLEREKTIHLKNDILLIGSTGFLGAHILYELLYQTDSTIYCLIRGTSEEHSKMRLKERLRYYFGSTLDIFFESKRIIVINGDFSKNDLGVSEYNYSLLLNSIKTVINSAAIVKHVGDYNYFYKMNILSVKNLIDFCKKCNDSHLVHISTLSVSGNNCSCSGVSNFTEKDLFIDQNYEQNVYIKTKFEAEQLLAKALLDGLDITIFRLGNITWRNSDGIFQINETENLFYNLLKFMTNVKQLPHASKDHYFNISPVNECANLITRILIHENINKIYHIYNSNILTTKNIVDILNNLGYNIKFVDNEQYENVLKKTIDDYPYIVNQFSYLNKPSNVLVSSSDTMEIAKKLDFHWSLIDTNYMKKKLGGIK